MNILDLFSGIGGFSLGLERAGMKTIAFCEVDPACRKVLRKHWPNTPIFEDVKTLSVKDINEPIDIIVGGFPCQDISLAGKGAGLAGARSGLWWEFHRLIKEAQPKWVVIENVSALRSRGLEQVLGSLAEIGYDAQWHCIPASHVGAPHQRDRIWVVAYPRHRCGWDFGASQKGGYPQTQWSAGSNQVSGSSKQPSFVADSSSAGLQRSERLRDDLEKVIRGWKTSSRPASERCSVSGGTLYSWAIEPDVGRVADGISGRVDRLKQLGNAVVPQIPQLIGTAILEYEHSLA